MKLTESEQQQLWIELLGAPPEERQPGDMTSPEIADLWKIDRAMIYKLAREGKLIKVKVYDKTIGKSVFIYRPA